MAGNSAAESDKTGAITGCLLGMTIGDATGLASEGLARRRVAKFYPHLDGPNLLFRRGMVSDDTEHACMTAQALIASAGDVAVFRRVLARQVRGWLLYVPAGIGLATLKATLKLLIGVSPERSGVFSAGNGPAMRSPLLGVCYGGDPARLRELVRASTRLTHTDPKAEWGALAIALAAHAAASGSAHNFPVDPQAFCTEFDTLLGEETESARELRDLIQRAADSANRSETTAAFADSLGLERGISGYVLHTVPICLHSWFCNPHDVRQAVLDVVKCGGDTDTTGAITGAIVGAGTGRVGVPADLLNRLSEWPRTVNWMTRLGTRLAETVPQGRPQPTLPLFAPFVLARNLVFLMVVLAHGLRRLFPPY